MTLDQQLFELMCRAPAAIPEWFIPEWKAPPEPTAPLNRPQGSSFNEKEWAKNRSALWGSWNRDCLFIYDRAKITQWPSAYARMVMEAAKPKPDNQFSDKDLKGWKPMAPFL